MRAARARAAAPRGLSLLELAVVLAVIGILAAISVNSFLGVTDREKSATALKGVQMQVAKARQLAVTRNQPVRITVTGPTLIDARLYSLVRWEALPCADAYGTNCPTAACLTNACGVGGCVCTGPGAEVGPTAPPVLGVPLPGLRIPDGAITLPPALNGLCFEGGTGRPLLRNGGTDCQGGGPAILDNTLPFALPSQSKLAYVQIEPTTGSVKLLDCNASPDAGICP